MKGEVSNQNPAFNLFRPEGQRDMEDAKVITKVWLTNGMEYDVVPGSFHYFTTKGDRPQPFVQFQARLASVENDDTENNVRHMVMALHTIEVFPASVAGVGYLVPMDNEVRPPEQVG